MFTKKKDIEKWLLEMKIEKYEINKNLTIDVDDSVFLENRYLTHIPVQFGFVNGSFLVSGNQLTTLKGSPIKLQSGFDCGHNNLTSLLGCPKYIPGSLHCTYNNLSSFRGFPDKVDGPLFIYANKIPDSELVNFNTETGMDIISDFGDYPEDFLHKVEILKRIKLERNILNNIDISDPNIMKNKKRL